MYASKLHTNFEAGASTAERAPSGDRARASAPPRTPSPAAPRRAGAPRDNSAALTVRRPGYRDERMTGHTVVTGPCTATVCRRLERV